MASNEILTSTPATKPLLLSPAGTYLRPLTIVMPFFKPLNWW